MYVKWEWLVLSDYYIPVNTSISMEWKSNSSSIVFVKEIIYIDRVGCMALRLI